MINPFGNLIHTEGLSGLQEHWIHVDQRVATLLTTVTTPDLISTDMKYVETSYKRDTILAMGTMWAKNDLNMLIAALKGHVKGTSAESITVKFEDKHPAYKVSYYERQGDDERWEHLVFFATDTASVTEVAHAYFMGFYPDCEYRGDYYSYKLDNIHIHVDNPIQISFAEYIMGKLTASR